MHAWSFHCMYEQLMYGAIHLGLYSYRGSRSIYLQWDHGAGRLLSMQWTISWQLYLSHTLINGRYSWERREQGKWLCSLLQLMTETEGDNHYSNTRSQADVSMDTSTSMQHESLIADEVDVWPYIYMITAIIRPDCLHIVIIALTQCLNSFAWLLFVFK